MNPLVSQIRLCQLLNIARHAAQIPLRVDIFALIVIEAGQTFVVSDADKHWLNRANALAQHVGLSRLGLLGFAISFQACGVTMQGSRDGAQICGNTPAQAAGNQPKPASTTVVGKRPCPQYE